MAKTTIIQLVDDLDGSDAHETVKFGLDGLSYEIDLNKKNADKLRLALTPYVAAGVKVSGRSKPAAHRRPAAADRDQNQAIRDWAARKGLEVAPRGRIRAEIVEQYHRDAGR